MDAVLTLREIPGSFGEQFLPYKCTLRQRVQGRKFANENFIQSLKIFRCQNDEITLKAAVFHSQRKSETPHRVNISLNDERITEAHCSCKAGTSGECAHVLAVVYKVTDWILEGLVEVPSQPACTSLPSRWDKPRGTRIQSEPVSSMVLSRPTNVSRKRKPITSVFFDNREHNTEESEIDFLATLDGTPLGYLANNPGLSVLGENGAQLIGSSLSHQIPLIQLVEEPDSTTTPCGNIEFPHRPDVGNLDIINDYLDKMRAVSVTSQEAVEIERKTREQCSSELWNSERKVRLTASNFGRIMLRKSPVNQKLIDSIMKNTKFTSASTGYGIANEKVARNMYRKKTGLHVHDCGLIINPLFPCLGATPDGKVCDSEKDGILEIKCPFSVRDMKIEDILCPDNQHSNFHLIGCGENITINKCHNYWFQVQGQLLVSGAKFCDLVTFTRRDLHVLRVLPDKETMEEMLSKLTNVYCKFIAK